MTLTRLRPFGRRRKTYFYGVAGFVLAAHVVIGGMVYVMPETGDGQAPSVAAMGIDLVEFAPLADEAVASRPVDLLEETATRRPETPPALPNFATVGEPRGVSPQAEPIGPTLTDLPALVIEDKPPVVTADVKSRSSTKAKSTSRKKTSTPTQRKATRTRPNTAERSTPTPTPIPRAIPTGRRIEPERSGILDRLRDRRERN